MPRGLQSIGRHPRLDGQVPDEGHTHARHESSVRCQCNNSPGNKPGVVVRPVTQQCLRGAVLTAPMPPRCDRSASIRAGPRLLRIPPAIRTACQETNTCTR
jgi:hypothetical protein